MTILLTYFVFATIFLFMLLAINTKYKWLTQRDVRTDDDKIGFFIIGLLIFVFWPIVLVIAILAVIIKYIWDKLIPKE